MKLKQLMAISSMAALTALGCGGPEGSTDVPRVDVPGVNRDVPNAPIDRPNPIIDMPTPENDTPDPVDVPTGGDTGACAQTMCGADCVDLQTSLTNCGQCGTACAAGQVCTAGVCGMNMMMCPAGEMNCSGVCVNLQTSAANCGMCGRSCPMGQNCAAGVCAGAIMCPAGQMMCGMACADLQTDPTNCGGCGAACNAGEMCTAGRCVAQRAMCPAGQTDCTPMAPAPTCVDTQSSSANCGACGTACGAGQSCNAGMCVCGAGQSLCGRTCVNRQTDTMNCGACGVVCGAGQTCNAGVCGCPAGSMLCNGVCVNTVTDNSNCGACGNACGAGRTCAGSMCGCNAPTVACGGLCVNTQTDRANCGACARACVAGQNCAAGVCACAAGQTLCPAMGAMQSCVDRQTDSRNCGACGTVCMMGTSCVAGMCRGMPPANDTRAGATLINLAMPAQTLMADTTTATNNTTGACNCTSGNDVFYRFVLTQPEMVYADTLGATADTSLFFQDTNGMNIAAAPGSNQVACNDDSGAAALCAGINNLQSQVLLRLNAGTYYLVLSGCNAGASAIKFQHLPIGGGTQARIAPTAAASAVMGATALPNAAMTACCSNGGEAGLWWLTCPATAAESFAISSCNAMTGVNAAAFDVSISQYSALRGAAPVCRDDVGGATCGAGSAVTGAIPATIANQVGLNTSVVDGCNSIGAFSANIRKQACAGAGTTLCQAGCVDMQTDRLNCGSCDFRCAAGSNCFAGLCVAPPPNDAPANAVVINMANASSTFVVDTRSAVNNVNGAGCGCTSGPDIFYNFTIPAGPRQLVYADTIGSTNDTSLFIQTIAGVAVGTGGIANGVVCNDDGGLAGCANGLRSQVMAMLAPGAYRLGVSGCGAGATGVTVHFQHLLVGNGTMTALAAGNSTPGGTTAGVGVVSAGTCSATGPENTYFWHTCAPQLAGNLTASTCGRATFDTVLSQTSATRAAAICNDDVGGACGVRSSITAAIPAGAGIHTMYMDGFTAANAGVYTIAVTRP